LGNISYHGFLAGHFEPYLDGAMRVTPAARTCPELWWCVWHAAIIACAPWPWDFLTDNATAVITVVAATVWAEAQGLTSLVTDMACARNVGPDRLRL
jgi:hypothetical protein